MRITRSPCVTLGVHDSSVCLKYEKVSVALDKFTVHVVVSFLVCTTQRAPMTLTIYINLSQMLWYTGSGAMVPLFICLLHPHLSILLYSEKGPLHSLSPGIPYPLTAIGLQQMRATDRGQVGKQTEVSVFCWNPSLFRNFASASGSSVSLCDHSSCQKA